MNYGQQGPAHFITLKLSTYMVVEAVVVVEVVDGWISTI